MKKRPRSIGRTDWKTILSIIERFSEKEFEQLSETVTATEHLGPGEWEEFCKAVADDPDFLAPPYFRKFKDKKESRIHAHMLACTRCREIFEDIFFAVMKRRRLERRAYLLSQDLVRRKYPAEKQLFDTIWESVKSSVAEWVKKESNEWTILDHSKALRTGLALVGPTSLELISPKVILLITAVLVDLESKRKARKKIDIRETVGIYAKKFDLPEKETLKIASYLSKELPS